MKAYKLTNQDGTSYNGYQWGKNVTYTASGKGELCSKGWLHFYDDPLLAILLNPIHANIVDPLLWEAEAKGKIKLDRGVKFGCTHLTTIKTISLPQVSVEQRVRFAILCAKKIYNEKKWQEWAEKWLSGTDRTTDAANTAACDAVYVVDNAAYTAVYSAYTATYTARDVVYTTYIATHAARTAAYAAYAATHAARAADNVDNTTSYIIDAAFHAANAADTAAYSIRQIIDLKTIAQEATNEMAK